MSNKFYEGVIKQINSKKYQCIIPELGEPIIVDSKYVNKTLTGDKVLIKVKDDKYGYVQKLIERPDNNLIGKIEISNNHIFIKPWSGGYYKDFFVDKKDIGFAKDGEIVEFKVLEWRKNHKSPKAKVIKTLYNTTQENYLLYRLNLPNKFSDEVIDEVKELAIKDDDIKSRIDLRSLQVFSIDPENCVDVDDALSYEKTIFGYRIGIHIADVSHFIKAGSALDKEAYKRSFTIYFPNFNIPMIPHKLSNDLCSLLEGEDRLAVSLIINMNHDMEIIDTNFFRSVINNKKKFTYEEAESHKNNPHSEYYTIMNDLYVIGSKLRSKMFPNEMNLGRIEIKWEVDNDGNPLLMKLKKRVSTQDLIQSWMLITNRLVTEKIEKISKNAPWIYRVHNDLEEESLSILKSELLHIGLSWDDNISNIKNINSLLNNDSSGLFSDMLIKKFKPAKYSPVKSGHFSLGVNDYTHFTSPIRRYCDIIIHRILLNVINERDVYCADIFKDCEWISEQEKKSQKVENYYNTLMSMKFIKNINYPLKGVIIGTSRKGINVKTELSIEAIIPNKELKESLWFDEDSRKWMNNNLEFKIGDSVMVNIEKLNWDNNTIELRMI